MEEKNRLFEEFDTEKLEAFSADNLDSFRDQVFIEEGNRDLVDDLIRFGYMNNQFSSSGPISRTQKIVQQTYTSTGSNDFFVPGTGEVWQVVGGDTLASGGTGSIQWQLKDSSGVLALIFQTSVSGQEPIGQNSTNNNLLLPIYVTKENSLVANVSTVATSVRASISFIRVR